MAKVTGVIFALCFLLEGWAFATTINVTTSQGSGCTVENAIASLNAASPIGGCTLQGTGAFTINVPNGTFFVQGVNVTIQRSVTLSGASTSGTTIQFANPGAQFNAGLIANSGLSVAMRNFTLRGATGNLMVGLVNNSNLTMTSVRVTAFGLSGISQFGTASLTTCTIDHNGSSSSLVGGGINFQGQFTTIDRTNITNNTATLGGGVYSDAPDAGRTLVITRSLISQNTATDQGGGLYTVSQVDIQNTTFNANVAQSRGGAVRFDSLGGEIWFFHCTIANNSVVSGSGGGLSVGSAGASSINFNIIAYNKANNSPSEIEWSRTASAGNYNLIFNTSGWNGSLFPTSGNNKKGIDPLLQALQNQGGPTSVRPIPTNSPALNAIPTAVSSFTTDQRGFGRPARGAIDMGAFELQ